jgi:hypothetical protein
MLVSLPAIRKKTRFVIDDVVEYAAQLNAPHSQGHRHEQIWLFSDHKDL